MQVVLDIILLAVFGFLTFRGFWRGFVKSALCMGRSVLTLVITILFGGSFAAWLSETIGGTFAAVVGYILLFVLVYVGFTVAIFLVGRVTELPIIKQSDKLLGTLLGAVEGLLTASLLATVMYAIVYLIGDMAVYENSVIFKLVHEINVFQFLIDTMI